LADLTTQSLSSKIQGVAGDICRIYGENFVAKKISILPSISTLDVEQLRRNNWDL
jgi:hypothetical protein